jgi:hypothetical protein
VLRWRGRVVTVAVDDHRGPLWVKLRWVKLRWVKLRWVKLRWVKLRWVMPGSRPTRAP